MSYFYAATSVDLGDVIILLNGSYGFSSPVRLSISSQSGNDTDVNVYVDFSNWEVTVYCSRSVHRSACLQ